ncbi:DUF3526 domain-containing protein [Chryseobacterium arthrosphaerae]|uniref:DUF3526 domain-containing protein n=1 Tax=Chryseobacterium arthrosphaerae TaxID=651561 RepID=A0A432DYL3_9FLAO|nr:DUF3526 domain-containing protein [Chryseobacterium arthrosphaerae]
MLKSGDSHNPDDPYFRKIKDSLLAHYKVKTTDELPFNYGGFVMKKVKNKFTDLYQPPKGIAEHLQQAANPD